MGRRSGIKAVDNAFLELLESQTDLRIRGEIGKDMTYQECKVMGEKIKAASEKLQSTINVARRVLELGPNAGE